MDKRCIDLGALCPRRDACKALCSKCVPGKTVKLPQCVVKMVVYTHWSLYYLTGLRRLCLLGSRGDSGTVELNSATLGVDHFPKAGIGQQ